MPTEKVGFLKAFPNAFSGEEKYTRELPTWRKADEMAESEEVPEQEVKKESKH